jgi:hypothetical protein
MRHVLVETASGAEVKPGMRVLGMNKEIYEVVGFRLPQHSASTGRVMVKKPGTKVLPGHEREFYPSVFGLKIEELED